MTKLRALVGGLAVLVLLAFSAGCGLVSDQAKQQAREKIEVSRPGRKRTRRSRPKGKR